MPWRVGALTRALLCGDPRWYRPLSGLGWYGNGRVAVGGSDEKGGRFALVQDFMVGLRCCFARTISNMCYRTLLSSRTITTTHRCPRRPSTTFRRARFSPMLQRCQNRGQCGALRCGSPGSGRGSRRRRGSALIRVRRGRRRLRAASSSGLDVLFAEAAGNPSFDARLPLFDAGEAGIHAPLEDDSGNAENGPEFRTHAVFPS